MVVPVRLAAIVAAGSVVLIAGTVCAFAFRAMQLLDDREGTRA
jgi:hypothetical protein